MHNFTYITQHLMEWSLQGYITVIGVMFWPLFFGAILGYIYLKNQSLVVMAAAVLIITTVFGEFLAIVSPFYNFLFIIITIIISVIFLLFFIRRRVG